MSSTTTGNALTLSGPQYPHLGMRGWSTEFLRLLQLLTFHEPQKTEIEGRVWACEIDSFELDSGQQQNQVSKQDPVTLEKRLIK